jgi:DNA-binding PadR family transcriptional regulator
MNKTRFAILGMLTHQPMSGYDIKKAFDRSIRSFWSENYGHLYPTLRRLTEEGSIEHVATEGRRKIYALTESGRDALLSWLREPPRPQPPRNELILQLFFGDLIDDASLRAKVAAEAEHQRELLATYADVRALLDEHPPDATRLYRMTLRYGELRSQAVLQWCGECLEQL